MARLLEYQGKALFRRKGIPVPEGKVARSADEALEVAEELGFPVAVKAQVHAGGRGKAGAILFVAAYSARAASTASWRACTCGSSAASPAVSASRNRCSVVFV